MSGRSTGPAHSEVCEALLSALDVAVFAPRPDGVLEPVHELPAWLPAVHPLEDWLQPEEELPFLANFLIDAQAFWASEREGPEVARIVSGPWTERGSDGVEHALEA